MRQRYISLLYGSLLAAFCAQAAEVEVDGIRYNFKDDNTAEVIANPSGYTGIVNIPTQVEHDGNQYAVTAIAKEAFLYAGVTKVSIPEGVKTIGEGAFAGAYLEEIVLPNSLETLGSAAYQGCFSATRLDLGQGIKVIPDGCFYGCMYLESINIPDQVETIGNASFQGCGFSATSLTFGTGLKQIGNWAFYNFRNISSLVFPEGLVSIGDCAFEQCDNLSVINIPASVESIGYGAISGRGISKYTVDPSNLNYASYNDALYTKDYSLLVSYPEAKAGDHVWPDGLKTIGRNSCARAQFVNLIIPAGVETIEDAAFYAAPKVETLTLPTTLKSIGATAFYSNEMLKNIDWGGSSPENIGEMAFAYCWKNLTEVNIAEGLVHAPTGMFYGCENLYKVTFPKSLRSTGDQLFYGCPELETVVFQDGVETIGEDLFYECGALKEIKLPGSVTEFGQGLCFNCSGLRKVDLGAGIKAIPSYSFSGCTSIETVISRAVTPPANADFPFEAYNKATLYVPENALNAYKNAYGWYFFSTITKIEESGVNNVRDEKINCVLDGNQLVINGADGQIISVFDLAGKILYRGHATVIPTTGEPVIVKIGESIFKIK